QDGNVFSIDRVRGHKVVMNFIYTRCPIATMCPASTQRMMDLQRAAKAKGIAKLQFVSISLDPAFDTPTVLKAYAASRGIDRGNFCFLTGPETAVRDLLHQFGVIVAPGENYLKHTALYRADRRERGNCPSRGWHSVDSGRISQPALTPFNPVRPLAAMFVLGVAPSLTAHEFRLASD
ncbi:MAG: SCO family protein, partial [Acidimicrobiia bacterium]